LYVVVVGAVALAAWTTTVRVSVSSSSAEGNGDSSGHPALSTAASFVASFVAFQSAAVNLVADDTNGKSDEFIRPFTAASATVTNTAAMDRVSG
jgi:hypothetical protein